MIIRKATETDFPEISDIYSNARIFMSEHGNACQWGNGYPPASLIKSDIKNGKLYLALENDCLVCVFYFAVENDPTYAHIENGSWKNDSPYGVVHRIASSHKVKGGARFCLNWAFEKCGNLKIDTHRDNIPMQNLLKSLNFEYCGIIHIDNGDERIAFQKTCD